MQYRDVLLVNGVSVAVSRHPIELLVRSGGIDALVSSDDTHLSMSGGVSRAIRLAAGDRIVEEAQALVPLRVGDVAMTSAGDLPARHVFHAVTVDWERAVRPSEGTIRVAAERVFARCELVGVPRLAMPALGIGAANFSAEYSARLIVGALAAHVAHPTVIRTVVFSLPDSAARTAFLEYLRQVSREAANGLPHPFAPE